MSGYFTRQPHTLFNSTVATQCCRTDMQTFSDFDED